MDFFTKIVASIVIRDGGSLEETLDDVGDFSADNLQEGTGDAVPVFHRGTFRGYVRGQDVLTSGSFSVGVKKESASDATDFRIIDAVRKTGSWAAAVSTNTGDPDVHCVDVDYVMEAGAERVVHSYQQCRFKVSVTESGDIVTYQLTFQGIYAGAT